MTTFSVVERTEEGELSFNKYNTGLTSQSWKIQLFFERLRVGTGGGQRKYLTMSHSNHK